MSFAAAIALVLGQDAKPAVAGERAFNARYEFDLRLREFDRMWLAYADPLARKRALPALDDVGSKTRSGDLVAAAQALDEARCVLTSARTIWPDCAAISPQRRIIDSGAKTVVFSLTQLYGKRDGRAWWFHVSEPQCEPPEFSDYWSPLNQQSYVTRSIDVPTLTEGDHVIEVGLGDSDYDWVDRRLTISIVEKRDERLAALEKAIAALPEKAPRLERETASSLLALLTSLAARSTEETDYPGARLLAEAEQVVAAAAKGERWYGPEHAGEFFLTLPTGSTTTRARILVPEGLSNEKPAPLVVALHGRVFSEHTWFECYGAGKAPKECAQRKWLFAAPRLDQSPPPSISSIVDALASAYPVDRSKVFLVGHSMGGGIGLRAVRESPKSFRAFAAIGAGQALDDAAALKELSIFIAAGDHDFAREGAEALHESLTAASSTRATLKIYPNAEHWMTVADSLPDVFAFFDVTLR